MSDSGVAGRYVIEAVPHTRLLTAGQIGHRPFLLTDAPLTTFNVTLNSVTLLFAPKLLTLNV